MFTVFISVSSDFLVLYLILSYICISKIRKSDLAKSSADARPEIFSPGNALDAKITELDLEKRKIKLSVKAAQIEEEKNLVKKFGERATKSGATLKGIFEKALGRKNTKKKDK